MWICHGYPEIKCHRFGSLPSTPWTSVSKPTMRYEYMNLKVKRQCHLGKKKRLWWRWRWGRRWRGGRRGRNKEYHRAPFNQDKLKNDKAGTVFGRVSHQGKKEKSPHDHSSSTCQIILYYNFNPQKVESLFSNYNFSPEKIYSLPLTLY